MELYINNSWTKRNGNAHIDEAIAYSENGNHATIYTVSSTAEEADAKLMAALGELKLMPEMSKNLRTRRGGNGERDQGMPRSHHAKVHQSRVMSNAQGVARTRRRLRDE